MAPDLAVVFVHYHAAGLQVEAWQEVAAAARTAGLTLEGVVVDNGSDARERALLSALPVVLVDAADNPGYAGGANRGVAATTAPLIAVLNPDVLVASDGLATLAEALRSGADVVGPRFTWDRGGRFLLPPTERRTAGAELLAALAGRNAWLERRARAAWRRHARRHWRAERPLASRSLSGALLAFRREAWQRTGPFDAGYRLYFEECDWLARAARAGLALRYVPAACAVHLYDRSARVEARASGWFRESQARFRRRHHGRAIAGLIERLERGTPSAPWPERRLAGRPRLDFADLASGTELWVEVSPASRGFPAAAERLPTGPGTRSPWELPEEVWSELGDGRHSLRLVDGGGRELAAWWFAREAADD